MLTYFHCQIFNFIVFVTSHHSWIFRNLSILFFYIHHQALNSSLVILFKFIAQIPGPLSMSSNFNLVDTKSWSLNGKCFIFASTTLLHQPLRRFTFALFGIAFVLFYFYVCAFFIYHLRLFILTHLRVHLPSAKCIVAFVARCSPTGRWK